MSRSYGNHPISWSQNSPPRKFLGLNTCISAWERFALHPFHFTRLYNLEPRLCSDASCKLWNEV